MGRKVQQSTENVEDASIVSGSLLEALLLSAVAVGSTLLVFVAASNSFMWHIQRFWGASGDFWQEQWEKVYDRFGHDEFNFLFWGSLIVGTGTYWVLNAGLAVMDLTNKPHFLTKYKIQEDKNVPMDMAKFWHAVRWTIFNTTVMNAATLMFLYPIGVWRGCSSGKELPTFHRIVFEIIFFVILEEILFYYSHRLLHHPRLYKHIHKMHHEWTAPIGIVSLYSHPVEHVVSNLLPIATGPLILGSHITVTYIWFVLAITSTVISHCGYHFPLLPSPEFHDFHHSKFNYCFGVLGVLDRLHGTDSMFRNSKEYLRHTLLLGLTPLNISIPDKSK